MSSMTKTKAVKTLTSPGAFGSSFIFRITHTPSATDEFKTQCSLVLVLAELVFVLLKYYYAGYKRRHAVYTILFYSGENVADCTCSKFTTELTVAYYLYSIEVGRDELFEYCNEGNKLPRMMAFEGVPGSKDSWSDGILKVVFRDGADVKLTKEEKADIKKKEEELKQKEAKAAKLSKKKSLRQS